MEQNFYTVLGISQVATMQEVKLAYKRLALKYHPDRNPGNYIAEEQFKLVNNAYQTLSNTSKRARYDMRLMYQQQQRQMLHRQPPHHPRYRHTRQPAPVSERHYRTREQSRRFSRKDLYLTLGFISSILAFTILLKVVMDHIASEDNYKTAVAYIADGKYTSAHSLLTDAIYFEPEHINAYQRRAELEFGVFENYKAALSDLDRVIDLQEKPNARIYYMRGVSNKQLSNYQQAEHDLTTALQLNNKYWDAYLARGETRLFYRQKIQDAISDLSVYIIQNKKGDKMLDALTYRGFAFYKQGEFGLSEKDYAQALSIDNKSGRVHYLMGRTKLELGQQEIACNHLSTAYDLGYSAALVELREICR